MKYMLVKDLLDWKVGYIINVTGGMGQLGWADFGWLIPTFIMDAHPEYFKLTP